MPAGYAERSASDSDDVILRGDLSAKKFSDPQFPLTRLAVSELTGFQMPPAMVLFEGAEGLSHEKDCEGESRAGISAGAGI